MSVKSSERDISDLAYGVEMLFRAQRKDLPRLLRDLKKKIFEKDHYYREVLDAIVEIRGRQESDKPDVPGLVKELMAKKGAKYLIGALTVRWCVRNAESQELRKKKFPGGR